MARKGRKSSPTAIAIILTMEYINEHHNFFTLLAIFSLAMQAFVLLKINGHYSIPSNFFALFWFLASSIPIALLPNAKIMPYGIAFISLNVFFFSLPSFIFKWQKVKRRVLPSAYNLDSNFLKLILVLCSISALALSSMHLYLNGFSPFEVFIDIFKQSNNFAFLRGQEKIRYGAIGQLFTLTAYAAAVIGGLCLNAEAKIKRQFIIVFLATSPCIYIMLTQSAKLYLFNGLVLFAGGILTQSVVAGTQFSKKKIVSALLFLLALSVLFLISTVSRFNDTGLDSFRFLKTINSYLLAEIFTFSDFFCFQIECGQHWQMYAQYKFPPGYFTFKFLYDWLSYSSPLPIGVYGESLNYPAHFQSNIYTVFRGLMYDFGIYGTLIFMFIFGLIFNWAYYRLISREFAPTMLVIYLTFLGFTCIGYLISIFMARYFLLLMLFIYIILWANYMLYSKNYRDFFNRKLKT